MALKIFHKLGLILKNITLKNIFIYKSESKNMFNVMIVDFSESMEYINDDGYHINEVKSKVPLGSGLSKVTMFSRRDDCIKLF